MSKDRYERKHRRTWRHPECVSMMAGADFSKVPSLAEAMGLTDSRPEAATCSACGAVIDGGGPCRLCTAERDPKNPAP